jgi:hypothetical protein
MGIKSNFLKIIPIYLTICAVAQCVGLTWHNDDDDAPDFGKQVLSIYILFTVGGNHGN